MSWSQNAPLVQLRRSENTPTYASLRSQSPVYASQHVGHQTINNYIVVKNEKYTPEGLDKYKVNGLKELCTKNDVKVKKGALRADYEKALKKL